MKKLDPETFEERTSYSTHYYGDIVRKLFLIGAVIMLITLPFFYELIPLPIYLSIFVILLIGVAAGMMNPVLLWISISDTVIAGLAFMAFEYYAVDVYVKHSIMHPLFWTDQILALVFLLALYYGVKTVRGIMLEE